MPWLVDGNNVAGGRDRDSVRRAALDLARHERVRIVVIFDGAPPAGTPAVEHLGRVEVRYVPDADAAIVELLRRGAAGWRLATDDRELGRRAAAAGAEVVGSAGFWDKVGGEPRPLPRPASPRRVDVGEELRYFHDLSHRLEQGALRVPRRRRKK